MDAPTLAIAGVSFLLASFALRRIWRQRSFHPAYAALVAACMLVGFAAPIAAHGVELGIPVAFAILSPIALVVVFLGRTVRTRGAASKYREVSFVTTPVRDTLRVLIAVLLSAAVALAITAAAATVLPLTALTRVVVAAYLLPIIWAGGMAWAISASRMRAFVVTSIIATLAGATVAVPRLMAGA